MSALLQLPGHEVRYPFAGSLARFSLPIRFDVHKLWWMSGLAAITHKPRIGSTGQRFAGADPVFPIPICLLRQKLNEIFRMLAHQGSQIFPSCSVWCIHRTRLDSSYVTNITDSAGQKE